LTDGAPCRAVAVFVAALLTATGAVAADGGAEPDTPTQAMVPAYVRLAYKPTKTVSMLDLPADFIAAQLMVVSSKSAIGRLRKRASPGGRLRRPHCPGRHAALRTAAGIRGQSPFREKGSDPLSPFSAMSARGCSMIHSDHSARYESATTVSRSPLFGPETASPNSFHSVPV
jgi:hypothetical protein